MRLFLFILGLASFSDGLMAFDYETDARLVGTYSVDIEPRCDSLSVKNSLSFGFFRRDDSTSQLEGEVLHIDHSTCMKAFNHGYLYWEMPTTDYKDGFDVLCGGPANFTAPLFTNSSSSKKIFTFEQRKDVDWTDMRTYLWSLLQHLEKHKWVNVIQYIISALWRYVTSPADVGCIRRLSLALNGALFFWWHAAKLPKKREREVDDVLHAERATKSAERASGSDKEGRRQSWRTTSLSLCPPSYWSRVLSPRRSLKLCNPVHFMTI